MIQRQFKAILCGILCVACMMAAIPAAAAEDAFSIFYGEDDIQMALFETGMLYTDGLVGDETVTWTAATEGVVEFNTAAGIVQAVGVGSTVVIGTTSDGKTDRARITVRKPLKWNGVGDYSVLLNGKFGAVTAAITVEQDGIYELVCDTQAVVYAQMLSEDGVWLNEDPINDYSHGFFLADRLYKDQTYYLYLYTMDVGVKGGAQLDITLKKSTTYTYDCVQFRSQSLSGHLGDVLQPRIVTIPSYNAESVTMESTDENYVVVEGDMVQILDVPTGYNDSVYLRLRDSENHIASREISLYGPRLLNEGEQAVGTNKDMLYYALTFAAPAAGEYCFYSSGAESVYAELYDENGVLDYTDSQIAGDFYLTADLAADEVVVLYVADTYKEKAFTVNVVKAAKPTALSLAIPSMYCIRQTEDECWVYKDSAMVFAPVMDNKTSSTAVELTFDNPSMVGVDFNGLYNIFDKGTFTATVQADGLSDTVTVHALEYILGDVSQDGKLNVTDAMAVYKEASGKTTLSGAALANADTNGDGTINIVDAFAVYSIASGKAPAKPDLSIDEDTPPTVDPTPGDSVDGGDW